MNRVTWIAKEDAERTKLLEIESERDALRTRVAALEAALLEIADADDRGVWTEFSVMLQEKARKALRGEVAP